MYAKNYEKGFGVYVVPVDGSIDGSANQCYCQDS